MKSFSVTILSEDEGEAPIDADMIKEALRDWAIEARVIAITDEDGN
jgi:hypothetical protein